MKKFLLFAFSALAAVLSLSSCEETVSTVYWIEYKEGSTNFTSNSYLQSYVYSIVQLDLSTMENSFTGTESEAVKWFDGKMESLKGDIKVNGVTIPVLENTTATFALVTFNESDSAEYNKEVKRETVTFKEQ